MKNLALILTCLTSFSCSTLIPNIQPCAPTGDIAGVAALCQNTNNDGHRRMNLDQWIDFLYAQPERPDPDHPGKTLPAKGPAIALSSEDWARNETAIAQLCIHGKCTYEEKQAASNELAYRRRVLVANLKRMGIAGQAMIARHDQLSAQLRAAPIVQ